jgi:hypothetical protein
MADYNPNTKVTARVGPVQSQQGSDVQLRSDKSGALAMVEAHGDLNEAVLSGNVFTIQVKTATVTATTDISPLPVTSGRGLVGLINPVSSGKNASILKIGMSTVSGTPGGPFYIDVIPPNSGATLAGTAPINNLTLQSAGSAMRGIAAAVPANTVAGVMLRPLGGPAAVAAGAGPYQVDEWIDGGIIVPPGGLLAITAHATGTTHVVSGYITWEEIPI